MAHKFSICPKRPRTIFKMAHGLKRPKIKSKLKQMDKNMPAVFGQAVGHFGHPHGSIWTWTLDHFDHFP